MTNLLVRLFIKDRDNVNNQAVRKAYGVMAGTVGILCNILLFLAKLILGLLTGAISVTADAVNNLSDAGSSIMTLIGFKMAGKRADREHPYGHGRIEYITGLFISTAIIIVGFELLRSSFEKIFEEQQIDFSIVSLIVLLCSVLVKLWMAFFYRKLSKKINSTALSASSMDSLSDCLATTAVIVGMVIGMLTGVCLDAYLGMLVALFIIYTGIKSISESLNPLIGEAPNTEFVSHIKNEVMSDSHVLGLHDILVHSYGEAHTVVSLHAELPADLDILTAHTIIDKIEDNIKTKFGCELTIHIDPIITDKEIISTAYDEICSIVKSIDKNLEVKNLRITEGYSCSSILFTLYVPSDNSVGLSDDKIEKLVQNNFEHREADKNKKLIMTIKHKDAEDEQK